MRVVPLLFSCVSGRKNVLIHYIIKSESPVIQKNYRTFAFVRVELVGFEPTSKQGNHTLSTCLSWTSFSSCGKTQATNRSLIL